MAIIMGNLTRDPELKYTPKGNAVVTFTVATNRSWVTSAGTEDESTEFHNVVAWNKLAELCSQYLYKGRSVYVKGRIQTRSWEDSEGHKRYWTEIVADDVVFLGAPKPGTTGKTEPVPVPAPAKEKEDVKTEEVPF